MITPIHIDEESARSGSRFFRLGIGSTSTASGQLSTYTFLQKRQLTAKKKSRDVYG